MSKQKRIKSLLFGLFVYLICISNVKALTFDEFEVTWYYRNKSDESQLLNVLKQEDVPLYASTSEYVNGYTTRVEQTFTKQIQYIVNYQLEMWFSPEQELNYRSDTLQRIIDYSYVDSDFKILNTVANESWNRSTSGSGNTVLTINVSMQVLALNNTDAIRFGVYTNDNISIGFYNHTDQIDYYLVNNVSIEENANATIIDQNNQIINGQNSINSNINNMQENIINNQNDNNDKLIDELKKGQLTCGYNYKEEFDYSYLKNNGAIQNGQYVDVGNFRYSEPTIIFGGYSYDLSGYSTGTRNQYLISVYDSNMNYLFQLDYKVNSILDLTSYDGILYIIVNVNNNIDNKLIIVKKDSICVPTSYLQMKQNQETNNQLGDLNNSLNDSNVDGSLNNAGSFFDNFSTTDHGGLSGIITAPLVAINQMLNTSCNPMTTTFKGKELSLPCGYDFWNRLGAIQDFINIVLGGMLCYRIIIKLYKLIERIKNPEDDRLEVMDL